MATKVNTFFTTDLQGINQRQDLDKIPTNASPFLLNISLDKPGTWIKRSGNNLLATTAAGYTQNIIAYTDKTGANVFRTVRNMNIDIYNEGLDTYTTIDVGSLAGGVKVESANYLNRVYYTSTLSPLQYETGGATTTVEDPSAATLTGGTLAVAQNTLYIGQIVANEDRVYYSWTDTETGQPTDIFYDYGIETGYSDSTRYITLPGRNTALWGFGVTGLMYIFTNDAGYEFDISRAEQIGGGLRKVFNVGCVNPRAITECNGWMIWFDRRGKIWGWSGAGPAVPISWDIEDDDAQESILGQLTGNDFDQVCAGSVGNKFYFSIGSVRVYNREITNAVLKGLVTQNLEYILWSIDSYPVQPNQFASIYLNGKQELAFSSTTEADVYLMNDINLSNDDSPEGVVAIEGVCVTPFYNFGAPLMKNQVKQLHIKYRPQDTIEGNYLKVQFAIDSNLDYTALSDPDGSPAVNDHGVIDMYAANASTKFDEIKKVAFPTNAKCRTISIEFSNNQLDESFELSAFGFDVVLEALDIKYFGS